MLVYIRMLLHTGNGIPTITIQKSYIIGIRITYQILIWGTARYGRLVSKSGTKSVNWDYFSLKQMVQMKNPSMTAVLFSEVVGNE